MEDWIKKWKDEIRRMDQVDQRMLQLAHKMTAPKQRHPLLDPNVTRVFYEDYCKITLNFK